MTTPAGGWLTRKEATDPGQNCLSARVEDVCPPDHSLSTSDQPETGGPLSRETEGPEVKILNVLSILKASTEQN